MSCSVSNLISYPECEPDLNIKPSELIHIWKTQPCQAGDTLSGGEAVKKLIRLGLVTNTPLGYYTTPLGNKIVQKFIEKFDKLDIKLKFSIDVE